MPLARAHVEDAALGPQALVPAAMDAGERARVSGPGLRTFKSIADRWDLTEEQRRLLLGLPPRSTYHAWIRKALDGKNPILPLDTLLRISAVLGIHKALAILFPRPDEAMTWLKGSHRGALFGGQSPLDLMLSGTQDGLLSVRRYLDAWRGGLRGVPEGIKVEPVAPDDIVFV